CARGRDCTGGVCQPGVDYDHYGLDSW
nr:immunoglobulin heavy chain junction region [Macaca mulatta]MOV54710.1 immunoglobulin heavy chain junction region [Macaca mulatta]MOV55074.1 immunoglobulin heavy chain junction region [Macaca mulatta]MOV56058.1 immunoglobulin heavy chain junction region [Macaca mulatta]MOV56892.1 immunoglobulin heavy chain junction region [Macaca mulatta]